METKTCPKCEANMVKQYSAMVLLTNPPQFPWDWYCGCGHTEDGGVDGPVFYPSVHDLWKEANPKKDSDNGN